MSSSMNDFFVSETAKPNVSETTPSIVMNQWFTNELDGSVGMFFF